MDRIIQRHRQVADRVGLQVRSAWRVELVELLAAFRAERVLDLPAPSTGRRPSSRGGSWRSS